MYIKIHKKNAEFLFYRYQGRCVAITKTKGYAIKDNGERVFKKASFALSKSKRGRNTATIGITERGKRISPFFIASFLESANVSFVLSIATTSDLFHQLFRRFILLLLLDSLSFSILLQLNEFTRIELRHLQQVNG